MLTPMDLHLIANRQDQMTFERDTRLNPSLRYDIAPLHYNCLGQTHSEQMMADGIFRQRQSALNGTLRSLVWESSSFSADTSQTRSITCTKCKGGGEVEPSIGWIFGGSNQRIRCDKCRGSGVLNE